MKYEATTIAEYFEQIPEERKQVLTKLWKTICDNIPEGFTEQLGYGMPGFVVPHALYPNGYHCDSKLPLPFINIASQKHFIAFYHMGLYSIPELLKWFQENYSKHYTAKLDMGKSCIRFKKMDQIPYDLIGQLVSKISVENWINYYESKIKNRRGVVNEKI
jgi:uncharacterized protein YdhG (YjbR/CyaY superfamily)